MTFAVGQRVICTAFDWGMFCPNDAESLNGAYGFVTHIEKHDSLREAMVFVQIIGKIDGMYEDDAECWRKPWPFWEREIEHAD